MSAVEGIAALERDDWETALRGLLAEWEATRCPGVAHELARLTSHAARAALDGAGTRAYQQAWEARFSEGSALDIGVLATDLHEGTSKQLKARLDRLRERPPDPRITRGLAVFAAEFRLSSGSARPAWTAFFRLCKHIGDPALTGPLTDLRSWAAARMVDEPPDWVEFEQYLVTQIDRVLEQLPPPGSSTEREAITAAVDGALARPFPGIVDGDGDLDALFAAVLADPDDVGANAVWVDALLERGDDRGTFAALQREPRLTRKQEAEVRRLHKAHVATWMGSLGPALDPGVARFRRGLLEVAHAKPRALTPALRADPAWRTVEQLWSDVEQLSDPRLISLTRVGTRIWPDSSRNAHFANVHRCAHGAVLKWRTAVGLAPAGGRIRHLEVDVDNAEPAGVNALVQGFGALDTLVVQLSDEEAWPDGLHALVEAAGALVVEGEPGFEDDDAAWLDRAPTTTVHLTHTPLLFRSWEWRGGERHLVLSERSSLVPRWVLEEKRDVAEYLRHHLYALGTLPSAASVRVNGRGTWHPDAVAVVRELLGDRYGTVTLPKPRASR